MSRYNRAVTACPWCEQSAFMMIHTLTPIRNPSIGPLALGNREGGAVFLIDLCTTSVFVFARRRQPTKQSHCIDEIASGCSPRNDCVGLPRRIRASQ
jgi:hypothetical protein